MKEHKLCACCGAKMVEYKHSLSKGILRGLYKLARAGGGPINIGEFGMTYTERVNFQKMSYWGLVAKSNTELIKGGDWHITANGWAFLEGNLSLPKSVWTYRANVLRFEGEMVRFEDVDDGYKFRRDYAEEAMPRSA